MTFHDVGSWRFYAYIVPLAQAGDSEKRINLRKLRYGVSESCALRDAEMAPAS